MTPSPRSDQRALSRVTLLALGLSFLGACSLSPVRSSTSAAPSQSAFAVTEGARNRRVPSEALSSRARAELYANAVAEAHGAESWFERGPLRFDVEALLGGQAFRGAFWIEPGGERVRLELDGGVIAVWDGEEAWVSPGPEAFPSARFHLRTIPYLLALPFKLNDPGTRLYVQSPRRFEDDLKSTARLTFDQNVGDTPDDWFLVFTDRETHRLDGLAYIATYFTTAFRAEQDPHAVVFDNFALIGGVRLPRSFKIYRWSEELGVHGQAIGSARLRGMRFVEPSAELFEAPHGALPAPLNRDEDA